MRGKRLLCLTFLGLQALATTGCFTPFRRVPTDPIMTAGNETIVAYEMGRRDGERMHPPRMPYAVAFALPIGLVTVNRTGEWWAGPAAVSAITIGSALWAHNQLNSGLPSPLTACACVTTSRPTRCGADTAWDSRMRCTIRVTR